MMNTTADTLTVVAIGVAPLVLVALLGVLFAALSEARRDRRLEAMAAATQEALDADRRRVAARREAVSAGRYRVDERPVAAAIVEGSLERRRATRAQRPERAAT
jgi:Anti-sigma-28 factor, FlgM